MELEMAKIKVELQEAIRSRQQEQQKLAAQKDRFSVLLVENQKFEEQLVLATKKILEAAVEKIGNAGSSTTDCQKQEKGKREQELHDLALMVERLESGRQKLLAEIDSQSLEIERLFVENENLSVGMKDMTNIAAQWESQVHENLKMSAALSSRFDLVFIFLDKPDEFLDKRVFSSIFWHIASQSNGADGTPITARKLESLVRLVEARARLELREEITRQDALDVVENAEDVSRVQTVTEVYSAYNFPPNKGIICPQKMKEKLRENQMKSKGINQHATKLGQGAQNIKSPVENKKMQGYGTFCASYYFKEEKPATADIKFRGATS